MAVHGQTRLSLDEVAREFANIPLPVDGLTGQTKGIDARIVGNAKLDPTLLSALSILATAQNAGTKGLGSGVGASLIPVEIIVQPGSDTVDAVRRAVAQGGGRVTGGDGNVISARLSPSQLANMGARPDVHSINPQPRILPMQEVEQGSKGLDALRKTHAGSLGWSGRGVRIGIIDVGFKNYTRWVSAGRLPRPVDTRAFNSSQDLAGSGGGSEHGTACFELIHDMARNAEYVLAVVDLPDEFEPAVRWLVKEKKVDIISFSAGFADAGAQDGRSQLDVLVDRTVKEDRVLWVNSSGNQGLAHWAGDASNRDADRWVQFSKETKRRLFIRADQGKVQVSFSWDDWRYKGTSRWTRHEVDARLFRLDTKTRGISLITARTVTPGPGKPSFILEADVPPNSDLILAVRIPSADGPLRAHVFVSGGTVSPAVPEGSVTIPATARYSLAVGAVNIRQNYIEQIEPSSSRGPTDDGRQKPDISAFDDVESLVFREGFKGTSAAAPTVAGFAAQLKEGNRQLSGLALREEVLRYVRAPRGHVADAAYGRGILDASVVQVPIPIDTVRLPNVLGGPVSPALIDSMVTKASQFRAFRALLGVDHGAKPVYQPGATAVVAVGCLVRCYYAVLVQDSSGQYTVSSAPEVALEAGTKVPIPVLVSQSPGRGAFILMAASRPLERGALLDVNPARLGGILAVAVVEFESSR